MKIVIVSCSLGLWTLVAGGTGEPVSADEQATTAAPAAAATEEGCGGCAEGDAVASSAAGMEAGCGGCADGTTDAPPKVAAEEGCGGCGDAVAATSHDPADLAKGMTLAEFTPVSKILAAPADFEGQRVLVRGVAVNVCAKRGCWVDLKSEASNDAALRVKVEDGEIVFPLTLKGHEVVVEGVVEKMVVPEETLRELQQKRAEAAGETFDPKSVTGPQIKWQLKGLGARWES